MKNDDYMILSKHFKNYHQMVKYYQSLNNVPNDLYHQNLYHLIRGITKVFNECSILYQQIIELSWWKGEHLDEVIAPALNLSVNALNKGRRTIIKQLANEIGWV